MSWKLTWFSEISLGLMAIRRQSQPTRPHMNPPNKTIKPPAAMNPEITGEPAEPKLHHEPPPAGFVYSKSTPHRVCLGVPARSLRVCACVHACVLYDAWMRLHEPAGPSVFVHAFVRLCVCTHVRLIAHLTQTNPWSYNHLISPAKVPVLLHLCLIYVCVPQDNGVIIN